MMRFETDIDGQANLIFTPSEVTALETNPPTQASMQTSGELGFELGYRYPDTDLGVVLHGLSRLSVPSTTLVRFVKSVGEGMDKHRSELIEMHEKWAGEPEPETTAFISIDIYELLHKGAINRELDRRIVGAERDMSGLLKSAVRKARTT